MAERKREETKVRCSLSEKTSWQRQWELDGAESLSGWLRTLANDRVASAALSLEAAAREELALWGEQNRQLDGTALVDNAIQTLEADVEVTDQFTPPGLVISNVTDDVPTERRTETCPCGRPPFVFCGRCDG